MAKHKMSREELRAESKRSADLIRQGSKAELQGVAEMSKRPLSLQQMRDQVKRQAAPRRPRDRNAY